MNTTQDSIRVSFYPQRLSGADLQFIMDMAGSERLAAKSVQYTSWLASVACDELERRSAADGDVPNEVAIPLFNAAKWSNGELADALTVSGIVCTMARNEKRDVVIELLEQLDLIIRSWIGARLRRLESQE